MGEEEIHVCWFHLWGGSFPLDLAFVYVRNTGHLLCAGQCSRCEHSGELKSKIPAMVISEKLLEKTSQFLTSPSCEITGLAAAFNQ